MKGATQGELRGQLVEIEVEGRGIEESIPQLLKQWYPQNKPLTPQLESSMLELKLQYSGHLMHRANSLEKSLMLGKIEGRRKGGDIG